MQTAVVDADERRSSDDPWDWAQGGSGREAVQVWLDANDLEIRDRSPRPVPARSQEARPIVESWEEVLPSPFDDAGPMSRERHSRHVMEVWRAHGRKVVRDMPQWAIDIISEHEPSSAVSIRALLAAPPRPGVSEATSPQPEVLVALAGIMTCRSVFEGAEACPWLTPFLPSLRPNKRLHGRPSASKELSMACSLKHDAHASGQKFDIDSRVTALINWRVPNWWARQ